MANPLKFMEKPIAKLLSGPLNIDPSRAGKTLLGLNAVGMAAAAASDTFAAAVDKNTSAEDKKFLIPAGVATGIAKIGIYFTMTTAIIDRLQGNDKKGIKGLAGKALEQMDEKTFDSNVFNYVTKKIAKAEKAEKGLLGTGLFKKQAGYAETMKNALLADGKITDKAKDLFKGNFKAGFGVLGAFIGVIVGSAILTPIIRDVSAWAIQKIREKKNPELKDKPYQPYFSTTGFGDLHQNAKQPLSMKSYMAFTNGNMKI